MATITRSKNWVTGDILTAADLNNEFNNILTLVNGNLDSDNIGTLETLVLSNATSTDTIRVTASSSGLAFVVES